MSADVLVDLESNHGSRDLCGSSGQFLFSMSLSRLSGAECYYFAENDAHVGRAPGKCGPDVARTRCII